MISNLAHLHDQTKNVGVIVEHDTLCDICFKFAIALIHDAASKIILFLPKELSINIDLLCRQLHRG